MIGMMTLFATYKTMIRPSFALFPMLFPTLGVTRIINVVVSIVVSHLALSLLVSRKKTSLSFVVVLTLLSVSLI